MKNCWRVCFQSGLIFAALLFFVTPALAIPGIPCQFTGTVTINGNPAPNGTTITTTIENDSYSTTTVNGIFGESPATVFFVSDPNANRNGKTIEFLVNGTATNVSAIFETGEIITVNLAITQESPPQPPDGGGGSPGGGGGGGSSGGGGGGGMLLVSLNGTCINQENIVSVTYTNGNPVLNASVKILKGTETKANGNTPANGKFAFTLSEPGEYVLEVEKTGFSDKTIYFNLSDCTAAPPLAPAPATPGTDEQEQAEGTGTVSGNDSSSTTAGLNTAPITGLFGLGATGTSVLLGLGLLAGLIALFIGWQRIKK